MAKVRTRTALLASLLVVVLGVAAILYRQGHFTLKEDHTVEPSVCPVCEQTVPFKTRKGREHAECSSCGAYERHRLLLYYLSHENELIREGSAVLHFAPNRGIEAYMRRQPGIKYVTADLFQPADLKLDLTDIDQPDGSWDLVIVYHVLEHVDDDRQAMRELYRILRPGGQAILQVPLEVGKDETYEDPSITSEAERLKHFGQEDHVRAYGAVDFRARLEQAGFEVTALDYIAALPPEVVKKHRLTRLDREESRADERIWVVTRPPE